MNDFFQSGAQHDGAKTHDATGLLVQTLTQQNMQVLVLMSFCDFLLATCCNSGHELSQCTECFETNGEHRF